MAIVPVTIARMTLRSTPTTIRAGGASITPKAKTTTGRNRRPVDSRFACVIDQERRWSRCRIVASILVGIALGVSQTGVLARVSPIWIAIGLIVAVGLGIKMAVSSGKPAIAKEG
jgi:hypothetical protein